MLESVRVYESNLIFGEVNFLKSFEVVEQKMLNVLELIAVEVDNFEAERIPFKCVVV